MTKIRIRDRTIFTPGYKILSFLSIILIIALTGYAYFITKKVRALEGRLADLKSKNIEFKTEIDKNLGKLSKYRLLLDRLGAYYSSKKIIDEKPSYNEYKNTIRSLIEKRINSIAPEKPLNEGKWFVSKMIFISPTFAIVEYEDGHDLFSIFVQIDKSKGRYSFEVIK